MSIIEIKNLIKTYGSGKKTVEALKGVDLVVMEGDIFGVVGRSGAGKSTLIRCLNRLETPTSGQVLVGGRDLMTLSDRELRLARQGMGMIFQYFNLLSSRTVAGNIAFPLEIAGRSRAEITPRVAELLELVGLTDKADAYPVQLSGGQKQRVGIARALANDPSFLLCDEVTSALDPQTTHSILALISDVKKRLGLTVVIITHEMKVITEICDQVAVMADGRIVETGPVVDIFTNPRHPVLKKFIEASAGHGDNYPANGYQPKGILFRVHFLGRAVGESLIADLIYRFKVEPNIIQVQVDQIKGLHYGAFLLDLIGEAVALRRALEYLQSLDLTLEFF